MATHGAAPAGALKATGLFPPSSVYRRFREFWRQGLLAYDGLARIG
jgi:hypothetical protein